jgi:peptidylprolyl isomerase
VSARRHSLRALALAASLGLLLSACGDDGDDAAPTPPPSPKVCPLTTTTVPADPTISTDLTVKPVVPAHTAPEPTGITVADVVVGTGREVKTGDRMKLKYVGAIYTTGAEFDSSWKIAADSTLDLGGELPRACYEGVVKGFSVGPIGMKEGGRREISFPAGYGYGDAGSGEDIPPGASLVFVVDLVGFGD